MKPPLARYDVNPDACRVTPEEIDALVDQLTAVAPPLLRIDCFPQYSGRDAHAFTFGDVEGNVSDKHRLFIARPHAHEPGATAACTELIRMLADCPGGMTGNEDWRDWVLDRFVITLLPDANPGGSRRAPVKFWDGTDVPNEQFFLWMFGESAERPGERFPRVASWDSRKVVPPGLLGIAYEQIDAFTYVEPNRDYRSTLFRSFHDLDRTFHYDVWLDLHQTEFINSEHNCAAFLPACWDDMSPADQDLALSLGEAIQARWEREGGRTTVAPGAPYRNNDAQRIFLSRVWLPITRRMVHAITEVQNNSPKTPVQEQVWLQLAAVDETMAWMAAGGEKRRMT